MPAARRKPVAKPSEKTDPEAGSAVETPAEAPDVAVEPADGLAGPVYMTAESFASLGVSREALADAETVLGWVHGDGGVSWVSHADLVARAVQRWGEHGAVDRLNAAVGLLDRAGRLVRL